MKQWQAVIEGLLFLSGDEGITLAQLSQCLEGVLPDELQEVLQALAERYAQEDHGIELVHFGGHYKFVSKESVYPYAQRLFASVKPVSLSNAAMETLAIIAYKQPITRTEIEEIRGVGCDLMLKKLIARGLVAEAGRMDIPGRPILYQVTDTFMDSFQLESLEELPQLPKVQMNLDEDLFVEEREQPADEMAENEGM